MKLSELRELAEKSPGKWYVEGPGDRYIYGPDGDAIAECFDIPGAAEHAALIVAAHNALPLLVEVAEKAATYINDIDNGLVSGCHDRRVQLRNDLRAALKRLEEG